MAVKIARTRKSDKLALLENESAFVGIDTHKESSTVSVWTSRRDIIVTWTQPTDAESLARKLEPIRTRIQHVVYEAGPTGYWLHHVLAAKGFPIDVIAPSRTPQAPNRNGKSDRRDSRELARLAGKGMLTPIVVPTPQQEADRQIIRRRRQVIGEVRRVKQRIKSFLLQHHLPEPEGLKNWSRASIDALSTMAMCDELRFCLDSLLADLDHATAQAKAVDRRLVELLRTGRHATAATLVRRVPGVGLVLAATMLLECPRPERFETPEAVASYVGLAPWTSRSGSGSRSGPIVKSGKKHLRSALVEAAWQWRRHDPDARARFDRVAENTRSANKAIVALARHLAILLWRILTTGLVYTSEPAPAVA